MPTKGGLKSSFATHPYAVTYTLALLLTLSVIALVAVMVNCTHKPILVDPKTGELISQECILSE